MNTPLNVTREAILGRTHYGLNIYSRVLQHYYPGETVLSLRGRDCEPTKNPFNLGKPTLHIEVVNNNAAHEDLEGAIPNGDAFDFAARHFKLSDEALLMFLDEEMGLGIRKKIPPIIAEHYMDKVAEVTPLPIYCPSFSYFEAPVTNTMPYDTASLLEIYAMLKDAMLKERTLELRSIKDKQAARKFKAANFDYVTFSGTFSKRCDSALIRHSSLMTIDFDHIPDILRLRELLLQDEYFETELLFVSPSGDGLKWIIPIDISANKHKDYFQAISSYIKQTYGLNVDQSGKDVSRACFIGHDAEAFINPKYLPKNG